MKAIELPAYTLNIVRAVKSMSMVERKTGTPASDEVCVEIMAAPINPSDISFIQGRYRVQKSLPAIPGFEACGKVVQAGDSPEAQALIGKRMSLFSQNDAYGTWSEQVIVKATNCIEVMDELPDEQAACLSVNPFTAYAMFQLAKEHESPAIVLNAAGSQVARFIQDMALREGIQTINIVRKEETVALLRSKGIENIILEQDGNLEGKLKDSCTALKANIAFDAVGGEMTGLLFNSLGKGASVFVYGGLSGKPVSNIGILEIIFNKKILTGFDLNQWLPDRKTGEFKRISCEIQQLIIDNIIHTEIREVFDLGNFDQGLFSYIKNMSAGKVLLKP